MLLEWIILTAIFAIIFFIKCDQGYFHAAIVLVGGLGFLFCMMMFMWTRNEMLLNIAVSGLVCAIEAVAILLGSGYKV